MIGAAVAAAAVATLAALPALFPGRGVTFDYRDTPAWRWPAVLLWNASEALGVALPRRVGSWAFGVCMGAKRARAE